ncbi:DgyrCDS7202 [Dimorphilus gyrociliatus]|uniref:DgyrCDS7202 n=1 Tax=Dimorphilus gyrociliatus TaxID=2664684 RepID=A0A7I8VSZ8_9ANNE|nr:DgyrCDS7202 [Dimorphilus gyrociliatus]
MIGSSRPSSVSSGLSRNVKDVPDNSLEFLPSEDGRPALSRESSTASIGSRPLSSGTKKTLTPVKKIDMQAVKRKPEQTFFNTIQNPIDIPTLVRKSSNTSNSDKPEVNAKQAWAEESTQISDKSKENKTDIGSMGNEDEDSEDTESSSEEEEQGAPEELKMEFLTCLMSKDYDNATKLCKMILIYEPNHEDALEFQKLILEKIELDAEELESSDSCDSDEDTSGSDSESNNSSEGEEEKEEKTDEKIVNFNEKTFMTENLS